MKNKLQLVTFPTKKVKVKCSIHGVQKVVFFPNGGVACEKCVAKERLIFCKKIIDFPG